MKLKVKMKNLKIKQKLFIILMLAAFLTSSLGLLFVQFTQALYNELIYRQISEKFHAYSRQIEDKLSTIDKLSLTIMSDPSVQRYLTVLKASPNSYEAFTAAKELQTKLMSYHIFDYNITSIAIADVHNTLHGVGLSVNSISSGELLELKETAAGFKGATVWVGGQTQEASFLSLREIRETNDFSIEPLGTLIIRTFADKIVSAGLGRDADSDTTLLIAANDQIIYPAQSDISYADLPLHDVMRNSVITLNNEKFLAAGFTLQYTGWVFIHLVPYSAIFQEVITMKLVLVGLYLLILLILLIVGIRFSRSITKPLDKLTKKMELVEKGKLDLAQRDFPENRDEIGQLSRNFDKMIDRLDGLIQENYVKQLMLKDAEYSMLKAKVNPHFLYNTLDSINWLARVNGQTEIAGMVKALGSLLRSTVNDREFIMIGEELQNLEHYIFIQKFRFEERLLYRADIAEQLHKISIPSMILQPIVENSIKYGVEAGTDLCEIIVTAEEQADMLIITVQDTGPGMDSDYFRKLERGEVLAKGTGIGLDNIQKRLQQLFGERYGLLIESGPKGTAIRICLPNVYQPHSAEHANGSDKRA